MSDPKVPFQSTEEEKSRKKVYWIIGLLVLIIAVLAVFLFKGQPGEPTASPKMKQMQETVAQIQELETDIQKKQNEIFTLMSDYRKKTGDQISDFNVMNLTPEQKLLLVDKIKNEKDISIKSLLQDILDKNNDVKGLTEKVRELEGLLPRPVMVEEKDNHYKIAMSFLQTEKGLDKKKAMKLVERTALFEKLVPGFKVWNFYSDGEYGTFVTQGTAPISPNQIQRQIKKEITDARDKAIAERDQLQSDIDNLDKRRSELISQVDLLNQEKNGLIAKMEELNKLNEELQKKINSVFYIVDINRNLKESGILKSGFLRSTKLQSVMPEQFTNSIDLRKTKEIKVSASALGIEKIKDIKFYPVFHVEGTDYTVKIDEDGQNAVVTLVNDKKFRSERIVISVF